MTALRITRRTLLAGLGAAGAVGVGATQLPRVLGRSPQYAYYTYAAPDSLVRVAWYETYNGAFLEATNEHTETNASTVLDPADTPLYVPEATGPVLSIGNVLPGDSGVVVLGIEAEDGGTPANVRVRPILTANDENGRTEPEQRAGDGTAASGELADAVRLAVWRDDAPTRACDGERGVSDTTIVEDSLRTVSDRFGANGIDLGCLDPGDARCLGFAWRFDGGNDVQGDSVTFDVVVDAVDCAATAEALA
jgi:hypothetical protein